MRWKIFSNFLTNKVSELEITRPHQFNFNHFDKFLSMAKISTNGRSTVGYGLDSNPHLSQTKAFMESIERLSLLEDAGNFHSSATHWRSSLAKEKSFFEAIERDALIRWHINPEKFARLISVEKDLIYLELLSSSEYVKVVACASLNQRCIPYGTGASGSIVESKSKAFDEWFMSKIRHEKNFCQEDSSPHGTLHKNTMSDQFREKILTSQKEFNHKPSMNKPSINFKQIGNKIARWPLTTWATESSNLLRWDYEWLIDGPDRNPSHPNSKILFESIDLSTRLNFFTAG